MINPWRRFRAWLYDLRHPCTIIMMNKVPAKDVDVPFSYTNESVSAIAKKLMAEANLLPDLQNRAKERENERVRALGNVLDWRDEDD